MKSDAMKIQQRKSLEAMGLALPFPIWLVLFLTYLSGLGILGFVPGEEQTLRVLALTVDTFILGIFCAFKFPLWISKQ